MDFGTLIQQDNYYTTKELKTVITKSDIKSLLTVQKKKIKYYNIPVSFDIETSSFIKNETKYANMYVFMFNVNGINFVGRTWEEYEQFYNDLIELFKIVSGKRHLIIYVQNLAYEFQFIMKRHEYESVFATDERKVLKAVTVEGVEFRDSYILSGLSLAKMGENLQKYKVSKMVGDLDYKLLRHHLTPLTAQEIGYCINDVRVLSAYIQEKIESDGTILKIPMTNTGYVRNLYRKKMCGARGKRSKSQKFTFNQIQKLTIHNSDEYEQLKRAFQGGFTHASARKYGKVYNNVASYDFSSSYPAVILSEQFPMSKGIRVEVNSVEEFEQYCKTYCCVFDIIFHDIYSICQYEHIISNSKCTQLKNGVIDNGRVVMADMLETTITNVDYDSICQFYAFDSFEIGNMTIYVKDYLPKDMITTCLELFQAKTTLKGVPDKVEEYFKGKGMLNSTYGMMVTDFAKDEAIFDGEWSTKECDTETEIEKYNNSLNRFLYYPWGVFVTAYARRNLYTGILEMGNDYIYSDTDSLKVLNHEQHKEYFEQYNKNVIDKLKNVAKFYNIPFENFTPKTIKGGEQIPGLWDYEGTYSEFKTMGAKRYCYYENGKFHITIAGLGKKAGAEFIENTAKALNISPFEIFNENMFVPKGKTGKLTHTYIDESFTTVMTDYLGNTCSVSEKSYIHLEECSFDMSISKDYINFIEEFIEKGGI